MGAMLGTALIGDLIILPAVLIGPIGTIFERRHPKNTDPHARRQAA